MPCQPPGPCINKAQACLTVGCQKIRGGSFATFVTPYQKPQMAERRRVSRHANASNGSASIKVVGDYKIGKTLGSGGFGEVFLGVHTKTGRSVAVKSLSRTKIRELHMGEKIQREINILKLFRHPHIIRLYEVLETEHSIYLIMEHVSGGELFDFIVSQTITEDTARRFFQQLISAVSYCHAHQVVHRDLKPENVLLSPQRSIKLADFGLSNIMADGDFLSTSCGSPNYAAPEVVSGKHYIGPHVDVWSCGIILFALLTGSLPFDDYKLPNLFAKIKKADFHMPSSVPAGAQDLIRKMLVVQPENRITIEGIRKHDWFRQDLPPYIDKLFDSQLPVETLRPDPSITTELLSRGFTLEELDDAIANEDHESRVLVAYHLLADMLDVVDPTPDVDHPFRDSVFSTYVSDASPTKLTRALYPPTPTAKDRDMALDLNGDNVLVIPATYMPSPELDDVVFSNPGSVDSVTMELNTHYAEKGQVDTSPNHRAIKLGARERARFVLGFTMRRTSLATPMNVVCVILVVLRDLGYEWKIGRSIVRVQSVQQLRAEHNTGQPTAPMSTLTPDAAAGDILPDSDKIGEMNGGQPPKKKKRDQPNAFNLKFKVTPSSAKAKADLELRFGLSIFTLYDSHRYLVDIKRLYGESMRFMQRAKDLISTLSDPETIKAACAELGMKVPSDLSAVREVLPQGEMSPRQLSTLSPLNV
ncbi:Protein kinase domain [Carpediemonas membranifera]|uniref:non-specific serine/threonine protein kinase n=1 Tax=Carpediemonas membranifera TaxID=201153 RepID=A0A8J6E4L0_9EUKA|nr:Protein kinase domain [Carpediemonas membranifera]|eukprot:KAG9394612.1 Protein kinase domain [Carpediemonas membranifera]